MTEGLIIGAIVLLLVVIIMLVFVLLRANETNFSPVTSRLENIERSQERFERGLKEELGRSRQVASSQGRDANCRAFNCLLPLILLRFAIANL